MYPQSCRDSAQSELMCHVIKRICIEQQEVQSSDRVLQQVTSAARPALNLRKDMLLALAF